MGTACGASARVCFGKRKREINSSGEMGNGGGRSFHTYRKSGRGCARRNTANQGQLEKGGMIKRQGNFKAK